MTKDENNTKQNTRTNKLNEKKESTNKPWISFCADQLLLLQGPTMECG